MDVGRQQVSRREWREAAINFIKVLDELPPGIRASSQEMHFCFEMVQRPEVFANLVELRPEDMRLWHVRGRTFASSREWTKASSDYEKSLELLTKELSQLAPADRSVAFFGGAAVGLELAALKLLSGDELGYRDLCKSLMKTQVLADEHFVASHLSRASTLLPDTMTDWSIPLKWAGQSVAEQPRFAWYLYSLGIAQHRAGQDEQAIQTLKKSLEVGPNWVGRGQNYAVLALACHRLGRDTEAGDWHRQTQSWLIETNRLTADFKFGVAASFYLSDWLCAQVLLTEAEKLLSGNAGSK